MCAANGCVGPGDFRETWEARSPATTVRVQKFDEKFLFDSAPTSSYFSFDVQDTRSHKWRPVLTWMVDGDLPIQRQQVKFVTDSVVYAFGNAKYVVTTDGGKTWSEWDAKKVLPTPEAYAINDVLVSSDGTGSMVVKRRTEESKSLTELSTADFGVHWTLKNEGHPQ
jgi:photosystem II stability/assembly factor-like uncharacterized protein